MVSTLFRNVLKWLFSLFLHAFLVGFDKEAQNAEKCFTRNQHAVLQNFVCVLHGFNMLYYCFSLFLKKLGKNAVLTQILTQFNIVYCYISKCARITRMRRIVMPTFFLFNTCSRPPEVVHYLINDSILGNLWKDVADHTKNNYLFILLLKCR